MSGLCLKRMNYMWAALLTTLLLLLLLLLLFLDRYSFSAKERCEVAIACMSLMLLGARWLGNERAHIKATTLALQASMESTSLKIGAIIDILKAII
jgi:hypothetical protein